MTRNLPDELLFTIFEDMSYRELLICQRVCRSWYSPAKRRLLKEVKLTSDQAIRKFIASFDSKSNRSYYKAVNIIRIHAKTTYGQHWILDRETVKKLLFPFSNLNKVYFNELDLIRNFDEELCRVLLLKCPKLDIFHVDADSWKNDFRMPLERLRSLLTNLELSEYNIFSDDPSQFNAVQFITQFPRLQFLVCEDEAVRSFDKVLPIFEQLSKIKTLRLTLANDIEADFGERYSSSLALQRLSKITDLLLTANADIRNTLKIVAEFCTGLNNFELESHESSNEFYENTFYAIPFIKSNCNVRLNGMLFTSLSSIFSCLVGNMFARVPAVEKQSKCRILELHASDDEDYSEPYVDLSLNTVQSPFSRKATITYNDGLCLSEFAKDLFTSDIPIDIFKVSYNHNRSIHNSTEYAKTFLQLLENMDSLKQVELEVPTSFREEHQDDGLYEDDDQYHQVKDRPPILYRVEEATFIVAQGVNIQPLLNQCCIAFPNLKRLTFHGFSGIWRSHMDEFLLDLPGYSLENLTVDVAPVVRRINKEAADFFVLEVEILDQSEQRLYKISHDLLSCEVVNDLGQIRFRCRNEYPRVRLTVSYFEQVVLFAYDYYKGKQIRCVIMLDDDDSDDVSTV